LAGDRIEPRPLVCLLSVVRLWQPGRKLEESVADVPEDIHELRNREIRTQIKPTSGEIARADGLRWRVNQLLEIEFANVRLHTECNARDDRYAEIEGERLLIVDIWAGGIVSAFLAGLNPSLLIADGTLIPGNSCMRPISARKQPPSRLDSRGSSRRFGRDVGDFRGGWTWRLLALIRRDWRQRSVESAVGDIDGNSFARGFAPLTVYATALWCDEYMNALHLYTSPPLLLFLLSGSSAQRIGIGYALGRLVWSIPGRAGRRLSCIAME
jgi:hypothetical protein